MKKVKSTWKVYGRTCSWFWNQTEVIRIFSHAIRLLRKIAVITLLLFPGRKCALTHTHTHTAIFICKIKLVKSNQITLQVSAGAHLLLWWPLALMWLFCQVRWRIINTPSNTHECACTHTQTHPSSPSWQPNGVISLETKIPRKTYLHGSVVETRSGTSKHLGWEGPLS